MIYPAAHSGRDVESVLRRLGRVTTEHGHLNTFVCPRTGTSIQGMSSLIHIIVTTYGHTTAAHHVI